MKFFIYNPEPFSNCSNPSCNRFHSKSQDPSHIYECYEKLSRFPIKFQCSSRILKLSEPHPRHSNKKYVKEKWSKPSWTKNYVPKKFIVSTRLDHLAAPIFRRVYTTRQVVDPYRNVTDYVKQNLNVRIQRSMYNIYSRLQNVKFPNAMVPSR